MPVVDVAERNRRSAERLRELGDRLTDEELERTIDDPWTAAALFAHVAFWDRFVLQRWRLAADRGEATPAPIDDDLLDRVNDASLPQWLAIPPRAAVAQCLEAAALVDDHVAGVPTDVVEALVREGRERLVDRSLHRGDHLATIGSAFAPAPS
jgi:DinB superfamily